MLIVSCKKTIDVWYFDRCRYFFSAAFLSVIITCLFVQPCSAQSAGSTTDGAYVWATVQKSADPNDCSLVIRSTSGHWKKIIPGSPTVRLTADNRRVILGFDQSITILTLGTERKTSMPNISLITVLHEGTEMLCKREGPGDEVVLRNVRTGSEKVFSHVKSQEISQGGKALVLLTEETTDEQTRRTVQWVNLANGSAKSIWESESIAPAQFTFDSEGAQIAFCTTSNSGVTIWYYKDGAETAEPLVNDASGGIGSGLVVSNSLLMFSPKGRRLFFELCEREPAKIDSQTTSPIIWNYRDARPQALQKRDLSSRRFVATITPHDRKIMRLEQENEKIVPGIMSDSFVLLYHFEGEALTIQRANPISSSNGWNWNPASRFSVLLASTHDTTRIVLRKSENQTWMGLPLYQVSPNQQYILYYDDLHKRYCSYEARTARTIDLTSQIQTEWNIGDENEWPGYFNAPVSASLVPGSGAAIFCQGDQNGALVLDRYHDIWKLDLTGVHQPVNLTQGFARQYHFKLALGQQTNGALIVTARMDYNLGSFRTPGFYRVNLSKPGYPEALIPIGSVYTWTSATTFGNQLYVAYRSSAIEPPMPYFTRDFKSYTLLDDGRPQKRKAVRKELISWTTVSGQLCQGVLELPPDFDPKKKYPVIISYYETGAFWIGEFEDIEDESFYLKNGYLVFLPDIHYIPGHPCRGTCESVNGGAEELMKLPYVNGKKMGIMGTSMGGYETNCLVTHSNLFAAAAEGSGMTDFISLYGEADDDGEMDKQANNEVGQNRLLATPWSDRERYIENSPIFFADKVTTPLLIKHSNNDYRVPFRQGMEMFMALRRLQKPVWLLEYHDGHGGPGIHNDPSEDFTIRTKQFFDHYLKDAPAPKWMTQGVPYRIRVIDSGLELDTASTASKTQ